MRHIKLISYLLVFSILTSCTSCSKNQPAASPDITQIRSICHLATMECYYHNVAKSVKTKGNKFENIGENDRKFWIEYTGIARVGIDMSQVKITVAENKVTVYLPNAKLLSIDINEKTLTEQSYISSGDSWFNKNKITADDQTAAINHAQSVMSKSVQENTALLASAQDRAKKLIENYINQLGTISNTDYIIKWEYEEIPIVE